MTKRTRKKRRNANTAVRTGEKTQVPIILVRAVKLMGVREKRFHPMMAPTMAWEVETGRAALVMM